MVAEPGASSTDAGADRAAAPPEDGPAPEGDARQGGARDGDAAERFERWVMPEVAVMLRVARSITRNAHDAEDLVQDTMIRAYRAIDRFDGRHPRAWLLTILRNTEINRNRRRRPSLLTESQMQRPDPEADGGATAESAALEGEFDAALERAVEGLSPEFREVVELVDLGGLSYAEAAGVAEVPIGTVMSRLHRARARIRTHLEAAGHSPGRAS